MKYDPISRRQFLQGSGGFLLSVPLLRSLLSPAEAAAACNSAGDVPPRFFGIYSSYGNLQRHNWYPDRNRLNMQSAPLRPGHLVHFADLPLDISPTFDSRYNNYRSKLTFIEGSDIVQRCGHGRANIFGHCAHFSESGVPDCETIDQLLARTIYSTPPLVPSIMAGRDHSSSYKISNGQIVEVDPIPSARNLFDAVFGGYSGDPGSQALVVDRVKADFEHVRGSNRIGATDRQTLSEIMDTLSDLQNRLNSTTNCANPVERPPYRDTWGDIELLAVDWDTMADVIVAAFRCCVTRVANLCIGPYERPGWGDWHELSHNSVQGQNTILEYFQYAGEKIFLRVIQKMDSILEGNGRTLLDNSLVMWGMENCTSRYDADHSNIGNPLVFAGGANGAFRTGLYIDYRNQGPYGWGSDVFGNPCKVGIPHNWLLMAIALGFGLTPQQARANLPQHSAYNTGYGAFFPHGYESGGQDNFGNPVYRGVDLYSQYYANLLPLANGTLPIFSV